MRPASSGCRRDDVEELRPFRRTPGVGHVAGDEHEVERAAAWMAAMRAMTAVEPLIAARAAAPALDPEAVALADDMDVGEMRDAPDAAAGGDGVERLEIERLVLRRVGKAPDERGRTAR